MLCSPWGVCPWSVKLYSVRLGTSSPSTDSLRSRSFQAISNRGWSPPWQWFAVGKTCDHDWVISAVLSLELKRPCYSGQSQVEVFGHSLSSPLPGGLCPPLAEWAQEPEEWALVLSTLRVGGAAQCGIHRTWLKPYLSLLLARRPWKALFFFFSVLRLNPGPCTC
jgi:hypothetical protein